MNDHVCHTAMIAIVSVIAAAPLFAQDPEGWQKAKWDMTEAQIVAIYPGAQKDEETVQGKFSRLKLSDIAVQDIHFEVSFTFQNNRLYMVALKPNGDRTGFRPGLQYERMISLLKDKYGDPTSHKDTHDDGLKKKAEWRLKTTVIETLYIESPLFKYRDVVIQYRKRESADGI
jgi:hypothetical protein